jgi:hypothetical protein
LRRGWVYIRKSRLKDGTTPLMVASRRHADIAQLLKRPGRNNPNQQENIAIFVLTVVALTLTGCNRTEKDWTAAKQANTVIAYKEFLTNHPQGAHVEDARNGIEALDWKDAQAKGTIDAYEGYLKAHAGGAHAEAAKSGVESLDWEETATKGATAFSAYLDFHRKYPGSTRLTAVTADVECSQNLSLSFGGYGFSGTASMSSLNVDVSGHSELSGEYRANEAGARSLVERYIELGGTIGKLPHAHLLVAEVKGRPRIVAVDAH